MALRPKCSSNNALTPFYQSAQKDFTLYEGDAREILPRLEARSVPMIFADPPYFLSNDGFSIQAGKPVSVNKGAWDKSHGREADNEFNYAWIKACREVLKDSGTIWICGTFHNIFSVANVLSDLDFRILNMITWQKTNPPPNLSCRFFTHSTEFILWARKCKKVAHVYNYDLMHGLAGDRQMTDVWRMSAIAPWEKTCGKHPAQKPLALVTRAILAASNRDDLILDPFAGSSTTGIAANLIRRLFVGIEQARPFLEMSRARRIEFDTCAASWARKIQDLKNLSSEWACKKEETNKSINPD